MFVAAMACAGCRLASTAADAAIHDAITKVPGSLARKLSRPFRCCGQRGEFRLKLACPLIETESYGVIAVCWRWRKRLGVPYVLDMTITPMMDGK